MQQNAASDVGEKTFYDKIIVFDDMSTIADKSKHFAHFLTVSRKYGYICIYILHNIAQNNNEIWQLILSNTNIVVLFKSTVISPPIVTILYQNVIKSTNSYVPRNDLWLFNVYKKLTVNEHLMIDNRDINDHSIGRFRSFSESPSCQLCFYGMNNNDRRYIKYVAKAINNKSNIFKVVESVGTTICGEFFRKKINDNGNSSKESKSIIDNEELENSIKGNEKNCNFIDEKTTNVADSQKNPTREKLRDLSTETAKEKDSVSTTTTTLEKNEGPLQGLLNDLMFEIESEKITEFQGEENQTTVAEVHSTSSLTNEKQVIAATAANPTAFGVCLKNNSNTVVGNNIEENEKLIKMENNYNAKKLKIRNSMTNGSYNGLKDSNFKDDEILVYYLSLYLASNYHQMALENRFIDLNHRFLVQYLWSNVLPLNFNKYVNNFLTVNVFSANKNSNEKMKAIKTYLSNVENFKELQNCFIDNFEMIKYISNMTYNAMFYGTDEKARVIAYRVINEVNNVLFINK